MADSTTNDSIFLNQIIDQGSNIYGSRERIRNALIQYATKYLNLGDADIRKTSYLAYLIDQLSILSANHLFYDNTIYREFFFTDAQMSESVYNLAKWIGYTVPKATPATVDVMFSIPLNFSRNSISFSLSPYFSVESGDIPFIIQSSSLSSSEAANFNADISTVKNAAQGKVINNSMVNIKDGKGYYRPVYLSEDKKTAYFMLTFIQKELLLKTFQVPTDLSNNQFYSIPIEFEGQVSDIEVFVVSPSYNQTLELSGTNLDGVITPQNFNPNEEIYDSVGAVCSWVKWEEATNGIYTMSSKSNQYNWIGGYNKGELLFGNGILGRQPPAGSLIAVRLHVTKGASGNVIANTISSGDPIYSDVSTGKSSTINYTIRNPKSAYGGEDLLTIPEIKKNAITNLSAKKRLVSNEDYDNIETIVGNSIPLKNCYPILKRSDIKTNEIMAFSTLNYITDDVNEIVPTRNISIEINDPIFDSNNQYVIPRNTEYRVGDSKFLTMFNLTMNKKNLTATYDYILQNVQGSTTQMYSKSSESYYDQFTYLTGNGSNFTVNMENKAIIGESYPLQIQFNVNHVASHYADIGDDVIVNLQTLGILNSDLTANDDKWTSETIKYFKVTKFQAKMTTKWGSYQVYDTSSSSGYSYSTTFDDDTGSITYNNFSWRIDNYLNVPEGMQRFEFLTQCYAPVRDSEGYILGIDGSRIAKKDGTRIKSGTVRFEWQNLNTYYSDIIVRRNLDNYMMSSVTYDDTNTITFVNTKNEAVKYTKNEATVMIGKMKAEETLTILKNNQTVALVKASSIKTTLLPLLDEIDYGETLVITKEQAQSLISVLEDGNSYVYTIHNVPAILSDYYNSVVQSEDNTGKSNFEINVMQNLISSLNFNSIRMLTDFINVKFADTYGDMINLRYNKPSYYVESRYDHTPWWDSDTQNVPDIIKNQDYVVPADSKDLVYYIVNGPIEDNKTPLNEYIGYIALRSVSESVNASGQTVYTHSYQLIEPTVGMFVKVRDELDTDGYLKTLVWNGRIWKDINDYHIPLELKLKVEVDESVVSKSDDTVTEEIINALTEYFQSKLGLQKNLDRSEVIKVCRSIEGVVYAELISPEFDIRFDYDIDDLTQKQLLDFTPQYIGFRGKDSNESDYGKSSISVNIIRV